MLHIKEPCARGHKCAVKGKENHIDYYSADESTAKNWTSKSMIQNFRSSVALFML